MGVGLVQRRHLQHRPDAGPARPDLGQHADRPRRIVGERRCDDAEVRVPPQGAARHLRVQHRIPHRVQRLMQITNYQQPAAAPSNQP